LTVLLDNANPSAATGGCALVLDDANKVAFCPVS